MTEETPDFEAADRWARTVSSEQIIGSNANAARAYLAQAARIEKLEGLIVEQCPEANERSCYRYCTENLWPIHNEARAIRGVLLRQRLRQKGEKP